MDNINFKYACIIILLATCIAIKFIVIAPCIIESVDSISRDDPDMPYIIHYKFQNILKQLTL